MRNTIQTRRLALRGLRESDALALAQLVNNPRIACNLIAVRHPYTLDDAQSWLRSGNQAHVFAVILEKELIGIVGLEPDPSVISSAELGYWLGEPWWGRGLMAEAASAVLGHAFTSAGLERLTSGCRYGNEASWRILSRLGFRHVSHARVYSLGRKAMMEIATFELTRREWLGPFSR
jgi:RimJ/RimL family protein N-acetyltransferase